jgi:hypothetical protein
VQEVTLAAEGPQPPFQLRPTVQTTRFHRLESRHLRGLTSSRCVSCVSHVVFILIRARATVCGVVPSRCFQRFTTSWDACRFGGLSTMNSQVHSAPEALNLVGNAILRQHHTVLSVGTDAGHISMKNCPFPQSIDEQGW